MGQRRMRLVKVALTTTLLLASLLLMHPSVKAQEPPTYVGGTLPLGVVDWIAEHSPYIVTEDVVVPEGSELIIHSGVKVWFNNGTGMFVHGGLSALGEDGDQVTFTSNSTGFPGIWKGISITIFSTENMITYSTIEYATTGIECREESSVSISHSEIVNSSLAGVSLSACNAEIERSVLSGNNVGVFADASAIGIYHSTVSRNMDYGIAASQSYVHVESVEILENNDGIFSVESTIHLYNSSVESTTHSLYLREMSHVVSLNSHFDRGLVLFEAFPSRLEIMWFLRIRVVDMFSSPVHRASVTVDGDLVEMWDLLTGDEGWTETLVVTDVVMTNTEEIDHNPYFVNATRNEYKGQDVVAVTESRILILQILTDIVDPVAEAGDDRTVNEYDEVIFDASESYDNDPDFLTKGTFTWTFFDREGGYREEGVELTYVFQTPGYFTVKLRVEDSFGHWDEDSLKIRVIDITEPIALASAPTEVEVGERVILDASSSLDNDPDFSSSGTYTWILLDGDEEVTLQGKVVEYEFEHTGTSTIQLSVMDSSGNIGTDGIQIKVLGKPDEFPYIALISLSLICAAFVGAANTEAGKYWFLKFLILPLYVKLSKKDILDHFIRGQIYGYIVVHPGENYTTIKRNLDLKNGTLTYHLDVLEREGYVKSQLRGTKRFYYPKDVKMPDNGTGFPAIKEDMIRRIEESPGITISDLASLIGVSRQLTNYHLKALIQEGYVRVERRAMKSHCYPVEDTPKS